MHYSIAPQASIQPLPAGRSPRALAAPALLLGLAAALLLPLPAAHAQFGPPATTPVHDPAALKPPAGARVAIIEFEDMECPDCGRANPVLSEAAEKYHIPWIRHDFPLPFHAWSFQAAVNARWFDTKTKKLGDEYRDDVFANQISINDLNDLRVHRKVRPGARHRPALRRRSPGQAAR